MTGYVALLRAVNVGGTGKMAMAELRALCQDCGLSNVQTYIASGNVVFSSAATPPSIKASIEQKLQDYAGKPVFIALRTATEINDVLAGNPYLDRPNAQTVAIFLETAPPENVLGDLRGRTDEIIHLGNRTLYVHYPSGIGQSRLVIPASKTGTARNMNTVAKLAQMALARH